VNNMKRIEGSTFHAVFQSLLDRLREEVIRFYGDRLVSLVVYGSVGRGTMREDSDVDFLIVARELPRGRMARVREFERVEGALEPFLADLRAQGIETYLAPIFKTEEEALAGSPLFLDMVEDARILYDREGFFASRLEKLKDRLEALGARRIFKGNAWYWDLKPDYKPGDVIEL